MYGQVGWGVGVGVWRDGWMGWGVGVGETPHTDAYSPNERINQGRLWTLRTKGARAQNMHAQTHT